MPWKPHRLRKNWEFQEVIAKGKKLTNRYFIIFYNRNKLNNCQFGISIPCKFFKKAVDRNYYKRQIRHIIIQHLKKHNDSCQITNSHQHCNLVIIVRPAYLENNFAVNQDNFYKLLLSIYREN